MLIHLTTGGTVIVFFCLQQAEIKYLEKGSCLKKRKKKTYEIFQNDLNAINNICF